MPPRKSAKASEPAVFNLDDFRASAYDGVLDEREIDLGGGNTLHLTLEHLTTRQASQIPGRGPLAGTYKAMAKYIKDWDLTATNTQTGEVAEVPAPGSPEATQWTGEGNEWQLLELLDNTHGSQIYLWLTNPAGMKLAEEQGKARSMSSESTDTPASANGKAAR